MLKVLLAISWVLAVGCLASCAPRSAVLLEDEVSSERRRRMDITVVDATTGETDELTLAEGRNAIEDHCRSQQDDTIGATVCGKETPLTADECQWDLCQAENWLCVAQTALLAARDPSGLVLNNASGNPAYEVQPQDAESQVALAHLAQVAVAKSMNGVASGMLTNRCDNAVDVTTIWNTSGDDPVGEASTAPFMEIFASTLAEGLRVGEAAADLGTERALAVAQRDASAVGDLGRAARMEWFDGSLSRVQAAQAQVGGTVWGTLASPSWTMDSGDYDDPVLTNVGIGVVPPCGQNCSRALSALRRSGVDFADLVPPLGSPYDFSATEAQLDPYIGAIAGNLNSRIAHDADTYAGAGAEEFAASIEVSLGDLLQAVEQMRYEDVVYARPRGVALAEPIRISPDAMGDQRFIDTWDPTTLNGPVPPPAMHYLTQARAEQLWIGAQSVGAGDRSLRLPIPRPERAYLFAMARAIASEALADPVMVSADDAEVPLQSILQQASARRALDVEVCGVSSSATRVRVFGLSAAPDPEEPEELVIVEGLDGLRCAVQGALAGQPCTGTMTYPLIAPADTWQFVQDTAGGDPRQSRLHAVQFDLPAIDEDTYVVRRRPGATEGYGAYEPIAGFSSAEVGKCITIPYDWTSYSNAARIFDFSDDARTSTRDCAGVPSRLPLEDEIIDDSDAFEDSWQHHLRIASAAATHADQLGQDLIASGLQIDEESERRVDAIQELCGTHINVDLFSEGQVHSTPCNESSTPTGCPGGYTCIGTACLSDSLLGSAESAQRAALEDCLGIGEGGAIVPVVALGSTPLCAWRSLEHPDQLCTGSSAPCPYVLPEGGTCTLPLGLGGTHEVVAITNGAPPPEVDDIGQVVGLVRSVGPGGEDLPGTVLPGATCTDEVLTAIDTLRGDSVDRGERLDALEIIRGRQFFDYDNIRLVAGRIGWVGEVGNYSHITVDGGPMRDDFGVVIGSTGSPITGPAGSWPCAGWSTVVNEERPLRPMGPTSGNYVDCTDVDARAHMNWRFGRAAVVLTAFTDLGLGNHRMPALPYGSTEYAMHEDRPASAARA